MEESGLLVLPCHARFDLIFWHANSLFYAGMSGIITLDARDAASDAAQAAYKAMVELWTLYSFGVAVTLLRTYARVRAVGFRNLKADDYLVWVAIVRTFHGFFPI